MYIYCMLHAEVAPQHAPAAYSTDPLCIRRDPLRAQFWTKVPVGGPSTSPFSSLTASSCSELSKWCVFRHLYRFLGTESMPVWTAPTLDEVYNLIEID